MIDKIRLLVAEQMGVAIQNILPSMKFSNTGMDSLEFVELIQAVEQEFGKQIPDARWAHIDCAEDIARELQSVQ